MVIISGIGTQYILTHNLDKIDYGLIIVLIDIALTIAILIDFGVPTWAARIWDGKNKNIFPLVMRVVKLEFKLAIIFTTVSILIGKIIFEGYDLKLFAIVMTAIGIMSINEPLRLGLRLLGKVQIESFSRGLERLIVLTSYLLLVHLDRLSLENIGYALIISSIITTFITFISLLKYSINDTNHSFKIEINEFQIIKESLPFCIGISVYPLLGRIDKLILALNQNFDIVANYNVAWIILVTGFIVPAMLRKSIVPMFAEDNRINKINENVLSSKALINSLIVIGIPISIIISYFFMNIIFPSEYLQNENGIRYISGLGLFIFLLPTWIWGMMSSTTLEAVKFFNNSWIFSGIVIISIIINLSVGLIFVNNFVIIGVSLGSILSQFSIFLLANIALNRQIGKTGEFFLIELIIGIILTLTLTLTGIYITTDTISFYYLIIPTGTIIICYLVIITKMDLIKYLSSGRS